MAHVWYKRVFYILMVVQPNFVDKLKICTEMVNIQTMGLILTLGLSKNKDYFCSYQNFVIKFNLQHFTNLNLNIYSEGW